MEKTDLFFTASLEKDLALKLEWYGEEGLSMIYSFWRILHYSNGEMHVYMKYWKWYTFQPVQFTFICDYKLFHKTLAFVVRVFVVACDTVSNFYKRGLNGRGHFQNILISFRRRDLFSDIGTY